MGHWRWLFLAAALVLVALAAWTRALRTPAGTDERGPAAVDQVVASAQATAGRDEGTVAREARARMVEDQIRARGIRDERVLAAMGRVPRERFVPDRYRVDAYGDYPLPIGYNQTISQPYIVAYMSEAAQVEPSEKVLEIGTGSGYQAAVLSKIAREVYTVEIVAPLAERAEATLRDLGYANVHVRHGDGYRGWPDAAPFDAVVVTAAPDHVPQPLIEQLAVGGRLVIPVGRHEQDMQVITKTRTGVTEERTIPVRFVPLTRKPR
ncbi:MAG: protein-L-isoaspartate(D-aspartate) O-methyltransferase [Luteitalea sp.]|nr:protein-L-isoaspartate(D-aspartate) O-methyltransferase [Luteitalea sp.]